MVDDSRAIALVADVAATIEMVIANKSRRFMSSIPLLPSDSFHQLLNVEQGTAHAAVSTTRAASVAKNNSVDPSAAPNYSLRHA